MASVSLDESVEKLAEFCGLLAQTTAQLQLDHTALGGLADSIHTFEDTVEEAVGGFGTGVAEFSSTLKDAQAGASEELRTLSEAARLLATSQIERWKAEVQDLAEATADALEAATRELDAGFSEVRREGFSVLATACTEAEAESGRLAEEAEGSFEELTRALREHDRHFEEAAVEAERITDEATGSLQGEEQEGLEAEAASCAASWEEDLKQGLAAQGDEMGALVQRAYAAFQELAQQEGEDVIETFSQLMADALVSAQGTVSGELEAAATEVEDGAMEELEKELDRAEQWLVAGEQMAPDLDVMVDELRIARGVVEQVDQLLNAMES